MGVEAVEDGIATSSLTVDHTLSLPLMKPHIIELCKDLFGNWLELSSSCFSVEPVSGGITNLLLKVSVKEKTGTIVSMTVRLYGPNTEYVIDRERELQAIKFLSAAGFGAKLLGIFGNGMVQSFINARTLAPLDMREPKLAAEIAKQLCRFHQVEIPGSKEPQLWSEIQKFFQNASSLTFDDREKQLTYETILFKEVNNEILGLKELTARLDSPVVFAHNDLLSGNLMLNDEKEKLYFIDFEYGSYNYRGFDIGNHFNEYAGYDCDYSLYPSKDEQVNFFRHYLEPENPHEVSDEDIKALYVETNTFMLASHLYWALWALIQVELPSYFFLITTSHEKTIAIVDYKLYSHFLQAKMSPISFDYLGYFFLRYNEYKKQKDNCFLVAQSYLSQST